MKISNLLKYLLAPFTMYVGEEGGGGAVDDHDQDDDDHDQDDDAGGGEEETTTGEQADGSVTVETTTESEETTNDDQDDGRKDIQARRREERQARKQRAKEREERVQRELSAERSARKSLEARLAAIEQRNTGSEMAQLDTTIKQTENAYTYQKQLLKAAHEQHDGETAADATEKMMLAKQRLDNLQAIKKNVEQRQRQPAATDERLVRHASSFMEENKWYKPEGTDQDSAITRAIDNALAAEGWSPTDKEYWDELRARVKKALPHRSTRGKVTTTETTDLPKNKLKSVVTGSGSGGQSSGKGTFTLSAERVSALKEAGVWDDLKKREDAVRRFREYDKNAKG